MEIITHKNGIRVGLEILGEVDSWGSDRLRQAIMESVRNGSSEVAVDLAAVTHLGSSGLLVLLEFQKDLDSLGGRLVVKNAGEKIQRIFHALKINLDHLTE